MTRYDTLLIGAGAAGLYFAARMEGDSLLVLEKTKNPGTKLLMSGSGQCNLTHGGNIKDFLVHYGDKGSRIRTTLYAHNNLAVCDFFDALNVYTIERDDGKVFPKSMDAHDVRDGLLNAAKRSGASFLMEAELDSIQVLNVDSQSQIQSHSQSQEARYRIFTMDGKHWDCNNLVIACGGCSYPTSGSDGSIYSILERDLEIKIVPPVPALTPVFVENYPFSQLSGISFQNAEVRINPGTGESQSFTGDLLLTHRNLSGPVILNHSRSMKTGMKIAINYIYPLSTDQFLQQMKSEFSGNSRTLEHWLASKLSLPKRFCEEICNQLHLSGRKISTLVGDDLKSVALKLTSDAYVISGLGGFRQAMVTAGGVSIDEISLKTMESRKYPGLFFIGEVLDVDGDTGGYNLQFAFSSAAAAAKAICGSTNAKNKK